MTTEPRMEDANVSEQGKQAERVLFFYREGSQDAYSPMVEILEGALVRLSSGGVVSTFSIGHWLACRAALDAARAKADEATARAERAETLLQLVDEVRKWWKQVSSCEDEFLPEYPDTCSQYWLSFDRAMNALLSWKPDAATQAGDVREGMGHTGQSKSVPGYNTPPRLPSVEPPDYEPPTLAELAWIKKGGGGETLEARRGVREGEGTR